MSKSNRRISLAAMEFRQEQGDPWSWGIGQVVVGENLGTYYALSGPHSWADFDAYNNSEFTQIADESRRDSPMPIGRQPFSPWWKTLRTGFPGECRS
jgi:hypothetical protein